MKAAWQGESLKKRACLDAIALPVLLFLGMGASNARDLTFEDRVKAQEAIERIYYRHQVGATKPFEAAVSRTVIEGKVRLYLKRTVALERFWKTRVTRMMLHRELKRMASYT